MIDRATGRALLMDFGVARSIGATPAAAPGMTRVGEVVGTPEYMSPEQATGEELDGRSDLYSLGLVAHFAATGAVAFGGDSAARILVRQLTELLPSIGSRRPDLPAVLVSAIDRCLAKEPDARFADAGALIEALDAAQAATPDVPVAIRLFAQEAETLGMITGFLGFVAILLLSGRATDVGIWDRMIPVVVMASVLLGRFMQTRSERADCRSSSRSTRPARLPADHRRTRERAPSCGGTQISRRRRRTVPSGGFMVLVSIAPVRGAFALQGCRRLPDADARGIHALLGADPAGLAWPCCPAASA
jgi:hypothetical protein